MINSFKIILDQFNLVSVPVSVIPWGDGHIHETYFVGTAKPHPGYILQKINKTIFRDIPGMMNNIRVVTNHVKRKISAIPGHKVELETLSLVYTKMGLSFYEDEHHDFWRMYDFIPGTVTYQVAPGEEIAAEAGKAIAKFQYYLSDIKEPLVETIPDFHNIHSRIDQYREAKAKDAAKRLVTIKEEISFGESRFPAMIDYFEKLREKAFLRATHNDTKLNNILFDKSGKALCLVDLDTIMPGYIHFDYGDALRTLANTAAEDEKNLSLVHLNAPVYKAFSDGYLSIAGDFLTEEEIKLLPFAPVYLTFIIGLRFLTDYINGDVYYRIHRPGHNLDRAKVQFQFVKRFETYFDSSIEHG